VLHETSTFGVTCRTQQKETTCPSPAEPETTEGANAITMAGRLLSLLAAAAAVAALLLPAPAQAAPSSLACPQRFHGMRLSPNATLSRRRVATCGAGRAPGYTCCGRVEEAQLVKADAACRATASEACCDALAALRCVSCDGPSQLGLLHGVAPALCDAALGACGGDYFARDALTGTAHLCVDDSLLCARADELVHVATSASAAGGGSAAFCALLGYQVVSGSSSGSGGADAADGSSGSGGIGSLSDDGASADGASVGSSSGGGAYDELVRLQQVGFTGFPTALDAATATTLERAIARQARERKAAAAEAEAATEAAARAGSPSVAGALGAARALLSSPLVAALAAVAVSAAFLGPQRLVLWLRQGGSSRGRPGSGPSLPPAALRAARAAHLDRLAAASAAKALPGAASRVVDDSDDSESDGSDPR
jgi:hypothetical protein